MSRYDDDERSRNRTRGDDIRERTVRDPYEAGRQVRTYRHEDDRSAEPPWQAAHPPRAGEGGRESRWDEQPARYGGGYREDEELWSRSRGARGDARYGLDTEAERHWAQEHPVEGYWNEDNRHRAHGYGRGQWQGQRDYGRDFHGQSNSGYDTARAYGQSNRQDDARSDYARASWTQEHDYQGPRYGAADRGGGNQYAHADTYGSAGFRQQGKRYWFDEGDQRGQFRGTQPRGYERSDERLRELACERLTDADLDASDIEVKVAQGTVTLEGSVRARWMKHAAEDLIDDLGGVKDIQNHLRVKSGDASPTDRQASSSSTATGSPAQGSSVLGQGSDLAGRHRH
jgi:hypothetical protein